MVIKNSAVASALAGIVSMFRKSDRADIDVDKKDSQRCRIGFPISTIVFDSLGTPLKAKTRVVLNELNKAILAARRFN